MVSTQVRFEKEVFDVIDFDSLSQIQEEKCTPENIAQLDSEARNHNLPTLDELDQQCWITREMLAVDHSDEDIFNRDHKKGTFQRLIYAAPQELDEDEQAQAQEFIEFTTSLNLSIPEEYWTNDRLLMRLLVANKNNKARTMH